MIDTWEVFRCRWSWNWTLWPEKVLVFKKAPVCFWDFVWKRMCFWLWFGNALMSVAPAVCLMPTAILKITSSFTLRGPMFFVVEPKLSKLKNSLEINAFDSC